MRWCNSTKKEYPLVPTVIQPVEAGRQCHPFNHLFVQVDSFINLCANVWRSIILNGGCSLVVNGYCKDITLLYKVGKKRNTFFSLIFSSSKAVSYCSISPLKWVTLPKTVSFDKDNDQAGGFNANVMLLINVLLDNSVVIIVNFNQPSTGYFLEPD